MIAADRPVRHSRPYGCLLGGFAGMILSYALWPRLALASDWFWIVGILLGAVVGVLVQWPIHRLLIGRARRQQPDDAIAVQLSPDH